MKPATWLTAVQDWKDSEKVLLYHEVSMARDTDAGRKKPFAFIYGVSVRSLNQYLNMANASTRA